MTPAHPPTTFQQAAALALGNLMAAKHRPPISRPAETVEWREEGRRLRGILSRAADHPTRTLLHETYMSLEHLAALVHRSVKQLEETDHKFDPQQQVELLTAKRHDYGPNNILYAGQTGLLVRISDKVQRIVTLKSRGSGGVAEPIVDAYLDIIGYCVIWEMLRENWFTLPLKGD